MLLSSSSRVNSHWPRHRRRARFPAVPTPPARPKEKPTCACNGGYTGDGHPGCTDVNECATRNGGCRANSTCTNTPGSFSCACNAGYTLVNKQCKVSTAPSCSTNNGGCSPNATCSTPSGTDRLHHATPATPGNGTTCTDVNECATNNGGCSANAHLHEHAGRAHLRLQQRLLRRRPDLHRHQRVPHQQRWLQRQRVSCTNTPGSRTCSCNGGYTGDGVTCTDVNECVTSNGGCSANATCTNTPGSRTCACNAGYTATARPALCTPATTSRSRPSWIFREFRPWSTPTTARSPSRSPSWPPTISRASRRSRWR